MKAKTLPPLLMLLAGAVTSIVMFLMRYEFKTLLIVLLAVLVIFYFIGYCIKKVMESFAASNAVRIAEEGEVIEKEAEEATEQTEADGGVSGQKAES